MLERRFCRWSCLVGSEGKIWLKFVSSELGARNKEGPFQQKKGVLR
jgi:hypothetical protein